MNVMINYGGNIIEINDESRFFVKLNKRTVAYIPLIGYGYFEGTNNEEWAECGIRENGFSNDDTPYKIDLIPCSEAFSPVTFYWESFIKLLNSGDIIYKANEYMDVVPYRIETRIPNSCATIVEEGTIVADVREYV